MNLANVDLNLLVALEALLQEQNVTRAGARLGLTQPAMSAALGRLRRHFGDQLLVREGVRYRLTPLAEMLVDQVTETLRLAQRTFAMQSAFDVASSTREYHVITSDYALVVIGQRVLQLVGERAPNVRLRFEHLVSSTVEEMETRLRAVDILLLPRGYIRGLPQVELFRDRWVGLVWAGNADVGEAITMDQLARTPRITTFDSARAFTYPDRQLEMLGAPRAEIVVESFLATPLVLAETPHMAVLPSRLATRMAQANDLRLVTLPADMPPLVEAMWWHPAAEADPGHSWLRSVFLEAAEQIPLAA